MIKTQSGFIITIPYTLFFFYSVAHSLSSFSEGFFYRNLIFSFGNDGKRKILFMHKKRVALTFCNEDIQVKKQGNFRVILLFPNTKLCKLRLSVHAYLFSITSVRFKFHHAVDCCKQCIV